MGELKRFDLIPRGNDEADGYAKVPSSRGYYTEYVPWHDDTTREARIRELEGDAEALRSLNLRSLEEAEGARRNVDLLAQQMVYRGNSVSYIYDKKDAYAKGIRDLRTELATLTAERDKLRATQEELISVGGAPFDYAFRMHSRDSLSLCRVKRWDELIARIEDQSPPTKGSTK